MTRDDHTYGFRRDTAESLKRMVGGADREFPEVRPSQRFRSEIAVARTDGSGITARSGATPGTGNATIQFLGATELANHGSAITVRNWAGSAVAADAYILIGRDRRGVWWVVSEDCP